MASNGELALELFEKDKFDIILTDLMMPQMHGVQLINEITKIDPFNQYW